MARGVLQLLHVCQRILYLRLTLRTERWVLDHPLNCSLGILRRNIMEQAPRGAALGLVLNRACMLEHVLRGGPLASPPSEGWARDNAHPLERASWAVGRS